MDNMQTNGKMLARGLVLALALLILPLSGMASAEASTIDDASSVDRLDFGLDAIVVDAADLDELDELDLQALELADAVALSDGLTADQLDLRDIEPVDENEIMGVLVIVDTNGHVAWITVVVFYEDGSTDVNRYGPMRFAQMRERLADYDGRLIVNWIDIPVDPDTGCPHGLLVGQYEVNRDGTGTFRGQALNVQGDVIGHLWGTFENGTFHGEFSARGGDITGMLRGVYENGSFKGQWSATDMDLEGFLKGHYSVNDDGQGVFRGKWKVDCSDDSDVEPRPVPTPVDVRPMKKKPMLQERSDVNLDDEDTVHARELSPDYWMFKDGPMPLEPEDVNSDKTDLVEGGGIVDISDAAAGSTLGTISLLGAGFLRRRITGGI